MCQGHSVNKAQRVEGRNKPFLSATHTELHCVDLARQDFVSRKTPFSPNPSQNQNLTSFVEQEFCSPAVRERNRQLLWTPPACACEGGVWWPLGNVPPLEESLPFTCLHRPRRSLWKPVSPRFMGDFQGQKDTMILLPANLCLQNFK